MLRGACCNSKSVRRSLYMAVNVKPIVAEQRCGIDDEGMIRRQPCWLRTILLAIGSCAGQ
eukprot:scaffold477883_cov19-Prasinocladus_malaysianus.AAC.2